MTPPLGVLMVGAGEYTVGFVPTAHGAASDKPAGVVALTCFELRRQGLVGRIALCDMYGSRMPAVRATVAAKIGDVYAGLDTSMDTYPEDHVEAEPTAYLRAMDSMRPGDAVIVFVPDDLHAAVATAAARRGLHVLLAKPAVKTLQEHLDLQAEVKLAGVLACVEFHKRFDPMYSDARNRAAGLGPFSHFASHMAQPKQQLDTFRAWAGLRSDISYYLNSHHIDIHNWMVGGRALPERVVAMAATGVAEHKLGRPCEDTITLMVQWRNTPQVRSGGAGGGAGVAEGGSPHGSGSSGGGGGGEVVGSAAASGGWLGTAVYTASWAATKGDCHTQQGFRYVAHGGELAVDQAHRGYTGVSEAAAAAAGAGGGYGSYNPLYMRYTPDASGRFAGQSGYGFVSIARFLAAAADVNAGRRSVEGVRREGELAVLCDTVAVTAILHAGRLSLDCGGAPVRLEWGDDGKGGGASPLLVVVGQ
ncbi:hypothetical protein HYH02_009701 [Chlamydomonas schloesseri]|uniref:Gfo/Idh/MocA-like oxidoreductase N-terminal domain-containing protein n=1 Tax=Chlamydomonas schloesseri TaxID=2026947 RepID=A0A835TEG1_9CHLO|nr:hypothetical protein HYH02_009701 [Chlamydomonas schloesseri]|eukprot:KAG2442217.1 hypothetical protein HYH02_009701 [Chlamydomonas schloesseri]